MIAISDHSFNRDVRLDRATYFHELILSLYLRVKLGDVGTLISAEHLNFIDLVVSSKQLVSHVLILEDIHSIFSSLYVVSCHLCFEPLSTEILKSLLGFVLKSPLLELVEIPVHLLTLIFGLLSEEFFLYIVGCLDFLVGGESFIELSLLLNFECLYGLSDFGKLLLKKLLSLCLLSLMLVNLSSLHGLSLLSPLLFVIHVCLMSFSRSKLLLSSETLPLIGLIKLLFEALGLGLVLEGHLRSSNGSHPAPLKNLVESG